MPIHSIDSNVYVRHGTLAVPRSFDREYRTARAYLGTDSVERRLFDRLEHANDGRQFHLRINHRNNDYFDPRTNTIGWDPYSALRTTNGGRQSPALGLGHEVDHAVERPAKEQTLSGRYDRSFDNKEERRVILGSERHAAHSLGEDTRRDHRGSTYRVASPQQR